MWRGARRDENGRRGDGSNYLKAAEDALNGIAYADDRQIVNASMAIYPAPKDEQRVEIELVEREGAG